MNQKTIKTIKSKQKKHILVKTCSCRYCTMIDVLFGDPNLSPWECDFIGSLAGWGWLHDYSKKQKTMIWEIFLRRRREVLSK